MDLVYIVRPGESNDELRHSLRSVELNLPHDRVFIVGHTPAWVRNVTSLQTIQGGTKYANSTRNVLTACCTEDVSDPFVLMNDDFFVTAKIDRVPALHRGPVVDVLADYEARYGARAGKVNHYITGMRDTLDLLKGLGYDDPLSYELHVPLVINKHYMRMTVELSTRAGLQVPHKRTLYGNMAGPNGIGGAQIADVKVNTTGSVKMPKPFVSTCDKTFRSGWIGRRLQASFDQPGRYEKLSGK